MNKYAIVSEAASRELIGTLEELGYLPIPLPPHPSLPAPVASHPDLLLHFAGERVFCERNYLPIARKLLKNLLLERGMELLPVEGEFAPVYPRDILLDAARVGRFLFCLPRATAAELTEDRSVTVVPVMQGYAKCSVIPVGENALMTADPAIAKAAAEHGLDVLKLRPHHILLPGYDTGFFGGAASFAPDRHTDTILFCGDLSALDERESILSFCRRHGKNVTDVPSIPLSDVGTVFLFGEKRRPDGRKTEV